MRYIEYDYENRCIFAIHKQIQTGSEYHQNFNGFGPWILTPTLHPDTPIDGFGYVQIFKALGVPWPPALAFELVLLLVNTSNFEQFRKSDKMLFWKVCFGYVASSETIIFLSFFFSKLPHMTFVCNQTQIMDPS